MRVVSFSNGNTYIAGGGKKDEMGAKKRYEEEG